MDRAVTATTNLELRSSGERRLTVTGSDETLDRYRSVIRVSGWELERFRQNPVLLPSHDYATVPIGRALLVWKETGDKPRLRFELEFAPKEVNPLADVFYQSYRHGYLNSFSVGFHPKQWRDATKDEERELGTVGVRIYEKQELLELSAVSVPANPAATADRSELMALAERAQEVAPAFAYQIRSALQTKPKTGNSVEYEILGQLTRAKRRIGKLDSRQAIEREVLSVTESVNRKLRRMRRNGKRPAYTDRQLDRIHRELYAIGRKLR